MSLDFSTWTQYYNRWLRIMYFNFIFCCERNKWFGNVDWKSQKPYQLFCSLIYRTSSKRAPPEILDDDEES
jgi:hypothetical protein